MGLQWPRVMAESSSSSLISVSLSNAESVSDSFHSSSAQRPTVSFLELRAPKVLVLVSHEI